MASYDVASSVCQALDGGFEPAMSRREAGQILGVRESAVKDKVMAAHRKVGRWRALPPHQ